MNSHDWLRRQRNDPYVKWARAKNYRSRAAFKLIELDEKHALLRAGMTVLECGAAPGGWTQVLVQLVNSAPSPVVDVDTPKSHMKPASPTEISVYTDEAPNGVVIGCDINSIAPIPGATLLSNCEIGCVAGHKRIVAAVNTAVHGDAAVPSRVDCIVSDMAPNYSGNVSMDLERMCRLVRALTYLAVKQTTPPLLKDGGSLVYKMWGGPQQSKLMEELRCLGFSAVSVFKPKASRSESGEMYIVSTGFRSAMYTRPT